MKAVLISIKPKWCELIANGNKTVEVRKTKPKIKTSFKVYIYCTKAKEYFSLGGGLYACSDELYRLPTGEIKFGDSFELAADWTDQYDKDNFYNGKVIGEFVCDEIYADTDYNKKTSELLEKACLSLMDIAKYVKPKQIAYFWHISNLVIYDKPKELNEFSKYGFSHPVWLKRPPQSWCYVEGA